MDRSRLPALLRRVARVRTTARGGALAAAGAVLVAGGVVLDLADLVGLGAAALLAVAAAWAALGVQRLDAGRGALVVVRQVDPNPVVAGRPATARLTVAARARTGAAYERLARLRLSEQAAHELAGTGGIRAQVRSHPDRIAVRYAVTPVRRGRWPLGPVLTVRTDVFGLVRTTQPLGTATPVAVWPRTTAVAARASALGDVDRAAVGARLSSPDDSVLREYVPGDDPRRVHWPRSARQDRLMVRSDESAGLRPVTVLLDRGLLAPAPGGAPGARPPTAQQVDDGEWVVELAASVATSFLDSGRPARLVAGDARPADLRTSTHGTRRESVLDATVDLTGLRAPAADDALATTVRALRTGRTRSEITIAVLGPLAPAARGELAALGADGTCWALLVVPRQESRRPQLDETADDLRAAGWRVAACYAGTPPELAWSALTEGAAA